MEGDRLNTTNHIEEIGNISPMPLTYHLVLSTFSRRQIFTSESNCNYMAYMIFETATLHKYNLLAFCIMPDHVHLLTQPGNVTIDHFVDLLRFRYEYVLVKKGHKQPIWQPDYRKHALKDEEVVDTVLFIYKNPVRNGLVENPLDYPYSFIYRCKDYRP